MSHQKSFFKIIYKLHIYAGIFVTLHFAILSISGSTLLFKDEIQGHPKASRQELANNREQFAEKYDQALTNLLRVYPNDRPLDMYPDENNPQIIKGRLGINGATMLRGAKRVALDFNSGQELERQNTPSNSGFFDWMLNLHRELFLGAKGQTYIGFVGIVYVFMMLSGFFIYGKFMKGRSFRNIRSSRIPKLIDMHKFVGVVSFGWGLLIGITGMLLALNPIFTKSFQESNLKHLSEQYQSFQDTTEGYAPLREILGTALNSKKDSVISYIVFPGMERGIPGHYLILSHGTTTLTEQVSEYLVINAKTAKLVQTIQLPFSVQAALVARPLHFANYGGIFLKIIWVFFAMCSLAVALFGVFSFFMKLRKNKYKTIPVSLPKKPRKPARTRNDYPYVWPFLLMAITAVGIGTALLSQSIFGRIGVGMLLIPLFVIFFGRRKNA